MYEFVKLPEVTLLESVPDGANVLAEVGGKIQRVPGDGLGGGGSVPVFDLAAMGLPALELDPNTGAGSANANCDITELCAALDKGPVKLLFKTAYAVEGVGKIEMPISGIFNAVKVEEPAVDGTGTTIPVYMGNALAGGPQMGGFFTASVLVADGGILVALSSLTAITPEFDLSAMGLPALEKNADTGVSSARVECDTTDLRAALDNGPVKLLFKTANEVNGEKTETLVSVIPNVSEANGRYDLGMLIENIVLHITITTGAISAKVSPLTAGTNA